MTSCLGLQGHGVLSVCNWTGLGRPGWSVTLLRPLTAACHPGKREVAARPRTPRPGPQDPRGAGTRQATPEPWRGPGETQSRTHGTRPRGADPTAPTAHCNWPGCVFRAGLISLGSHFSDAILVQTRFSPQILLWNTQNFCGQGRAAQAVVTAMASAWRHVAVPRCEESSASQTRQRPRRAGPQGPPGRSSCMAVDHLALSHAKSQARVLFPGRLH